MNLFEILSLFSCLNDNYTTITNLNPSLFSELESLAMACGP